jgi:hypothetical protein
VFWQLHILLVVWSMMTMAIAVQLTVKPIAEAFRMVVDPALRTAIVLATMATTA